MLEQCRWQFKEQEMVESYRSMHMVVVWKERNARRFEDKHNSLQKVKLNCILSFHFWLKESSVEDTETLFTVFRILVRRTRTDCNFWNCKFGCQVSLCVDEYNVTFLKIKKRLFCYSPKIPRLQSKILRKHKMHLMKFIN